MLTRLIPLALLLVGCDGHFEIASDDGSCRDSVSVISTMHSCSSPLHSMTVESLPRSADWLVVCRCRRDPDGGQP